MRQLVKSWIEAEKARGLSLGEAIDLLNEKREMHVTYSRVAEWRRGVYVPSQVVLSYMLYRTLRWLLVEAGISVTDKQYQLLVKLLWELYEQEGKHYLYLV